MRVHGPERLGGQGLGPHQEESGTRAIRALLGDPEVRDGVDLVMTWRDDAYEVWSRRGLVRFRRLVDEAGRLHYEVLEVVGTNPIANQDEAALASVEAEARAARASGYDADDPARRFVAPEHQSYPFGYERVAQLFDSPHAPDLAVSPVDWSQGPYAGNHGALHVRQARAPLWLSGAGVRVGEHEMALRAVDVAPTALAALGFPRIDGADATGRTASERGVAPDVFLRRQDGRAAEELLDPDAPRARRLYVFLLDGLHMTELDRRLATDPDALPGLRRLRERAAVVRYGSVVNFPSITWPSHTALGTGAWGGHHDVVNPSYYLREKRETVSPQGQQVRTEGFSSPKVESLAEAFHRVHGPDCFTAAIYAPFGRGADHAPLEGRMLGHKPTLKQLTQELAVDCDPRWKRDGIKPVMDESVLDCRGLAQVIELFSRDDREPPAFVYHELALTDGAGHAYGPHAEGLEAALDESDRRIVRVLDLLDARGLLDETLFVVTADHGMAPQDTSTSENALRHLQRTGLACVLAEPMVWLLDLAVQVERAGDGRTGRVIVYENDALPSGEWPTVEGAQVVVEVHTEGESPQVLVRGTTGPGGVFGFVTPPEVPGECIAIAVHREGFNPRHLTLDGRGLVPDLRRELYG